ncbi:hypothetical protein ALC60_11402, partial [Trachymyrmex zeteki]
VPMLTSAHRRARLEYARTHINQVKKIAEKSECPSMSITIPAGNEKCVELLIIGNIWTEYHDRDKIPMLFLDKCDEQCYDMRAGCNIQLPREIATKRAVISVCSMDNACFAWSVVAALYPAEDIIFLGSSYPHYTSMLNLAGIEFPMTLKDVPKFERLNAVSINVYGIENKQILPLRLSDKKEKHANLLYLQDPRDDSLDHFAWIKNLSRLVSSQLTKKKNKKFFCDSSSAKLEIHSKDCGKMNDCAIRLPSEDDKWLEFSVQKKKNEKNFNKNCVKLRFIDSYKFLSASLDKLASYLKKEKLKIVRSEFSTLSNEEFELLMRKGVFLYEYVDCVEKLDDTRLPPRESFYSSLTGDIVSESDYAHAANVWQRFSVRTLGEYSDLYLKTDVLLLADIFENFRESCVESYDLDPAHYYTLPGFTWDAMLKHTHVKFELLTDINMVLFIERGIRGGLSQCSRYAQANNKYMRSYDPSKPSSYLMYYDVNNLYGWAMCQPLLYADFRWVEDAANFDASAVAPDSSTGYILEVDFEYPQHLHDRHTDLPFCPTRDKLPGKREDKLLATLYDKQRYVIHYRNLQQCTRHGLRIMKIHRVLQFTQSVWLRVHTGVKFDKPIYVGMCILDISKVCLYEFHHEYMSPMYRDKCKIMYTDTDSLIYHIECEDVYETMKLDIARFDTSDYPADNAYGIPLANKKVPGLMKDENNGTIMTEFVGLRAKMYALLVDGKKDTKKAKGVKNNVVARTITFDDYTRCLNEEIEMTRRQSCIRSKLHEVYTISESKIALSPYDDKQYVVPDSTETLPWGHWRIPL